MRKAWAVTLSFCALLGTPAFSQGVASHVLGFEIQVEPVFVVKTDSSTSGGLSIGPLYPGKGSAVETVEVMISTNQGSPYKIFHQLGQPLASDTGFTFPLNRFQFTVSDGKKGGRSLVRDYERVTPHKTVIFSSNHEGDEDRFTISYRVDSQRVIPAGNYSTQLMITGAPQ